MRRNIKKFLFLFVILVMSSWVGGYAANLEFSSPSSAIVLNSGATFKAGRPAKVIGYSELSLVKCNSQAMTLWTGGLYKNGDEFAAATVATTLLQTTSNAVNRYAPMVRNNSYMVNNLVSTYLPMVRNNSYLLRWTSNTLLSLGDPTLGTFTRAIRHNSNAIMYNFRVNSNALHYTTRGEDSVLCITENETVDNIRYLKNGILIDDSTLTLNTPLRVSDGIWFDGTNTATLTLGGDLELASNGYFGSDAQINGAGYVVKFSGDQETPKSESVGDPYVLKFTGDTIVDGGGNELTFVASTGLNDCARLQVDPNVSVTLRNMKLNLRESDVIRLSDCSRLTLQNVTVKLNGVDWAFDHGRLYIQDNVVISGQQTHFGFLSNQPMTICDNSLLTFDLGTTFTFNPGKTRPTHGHDVSTRSLLRMTDETSTLYFNGSTFEVPVGGINLTRGAVVFDNRVYINNKDAAGDYNESAASGITFGSSNAADAVEIYALSGARVEVAGFVDLGSAS